MKKLSLLLGLALGLASTHLALADDALATKKCAVTASCPSARKQCHTTCDKSAACKAGYRKCCKSKEAFPVDYSSQNSRASLTRLGAVSATQCPKCHHTPCCCK